MIESECGPYSTAVGDPQSVLVRSFPIDYAIAALQNVFWSVSSQLWGFTSSIEKELQYPAFLAFAQTLKITYYNQVTICSLLAET